MHEEITLLAISIPHCVSTSHSNQPVFSLKIFAQPYVCSDGRAVLMRRQDTGSQSQRHEKLKLRGTEVLKSSTLTRCEYSCLGFTKANGL